MGTETLAVTPAKAEEKKRRARAGKPQRGIFEKVPGSGVWWVRFVDGQGRYRREKIGSQSAAVKLYHKRKQQALERKKLPENLRQVVRFDQLCDDAAAYIRNRYADPQHDLGRLETVRQWFGSREASSIDSHEIETALDQAKGDRKWSASSYNHHHTILSLIFRLAIRSKKVEQHPMRGGQVQRKREDNSRVRYLSPEEEARLRQAIRSNPAWCEHEPELTLSLNTGLRRSSMYLYLVWENVDLAARTATVRRTKNGDPVTIPLNADAMKALMIFRSRGDGKGRVVRNAAGEPLNYPTHWFVPARRAAKIRDYRWHDNRHDFASKLRQRGLPLGNIAELLAHKGLTMTRRYAHLAISNLHEAVAKLESWTDTPVAPEPITETRKVEYVQ